jgi:hypothetical protein
MFEAEMTAEEPEVDFQQIKEICICSTTSIEALGLSSPLPNRYQRLLFRESSRRGV